MPKDCTISRLALPARIIMPKRVYLNTQYMPRASNKQAPEMKRR